MSANFHEVWWIASPRDEPWAGLRIAHFRKTVSGRLVVMIHGEHAAAHHFRPPCAD